MSNRSILGFGILALICCLAIGACAGNYYKDHTVQVTVTGKESVSVEGGGHEYRIYGSNETFVMEDSIAKGRFRTADDYGKLRQGQTYNCKAFGWRVPLFSGFRNLHDCRLVLR